MWVLSQGSWLRFLATILATVIFNSGGATAKSGVSLSRCASFMCISPAQWTCSECGQPYCFFHTTTHGHELQITPEEDLAVSA